MSTLSSFVDDVLADVDAAKQTKLAEHTVVSELAAQPTSDLANQLLKLASDIRSQPTTLSYADLTQFMRGTGNG